LARQYAAVHKLPFATFQVGILSEPGQLFGEYTLEDNETRYKEFLFPKALKTRGCVIHLEEINRPENPKALNMLFSILSDDRQVWLDELGMVSVAPGVVFFATMNEGDEFVGTELLDPALRDRFYITRLDYLPEEVECEVLRKKANVSDEQSKEIINIINLIRSNRDYDVDCSTRKVLMIGEMVAAGCSLPDALTVTLQTDKRTLESILIALHLEQQINTKEHSEYIRYASSQ
jgi:nitric oxide reductase NorQ protein